MINYYVRVKNALHNKKGQGMVEYGLIIGLVAVLLIAALGTMRGAIEAKFDEITAALGS
ncbi:MAG TPA: Flp family type IVb pilin [Firmicutes bacterium]|nr:Flp family type IVb pilin [Bacillota bacterium]